MSAVVAAARRAAGVRFRPHGRDPAYGLDCVGLAALALREAGFGGFVPDDYPLRGGQPAQIVASVNESGLVPAADARAGDLLLCQSAAGQLHLAIDSGDGVIHADAAARCVVERPGPVPWPVIGRWRIPQEKDERIWRP